MKKGGYVGLYGSHSGDWRRRCTELLEAAGIASYDPTDERWQGIDEDNGDEKQNLIDELVAEQHRGILDAACIVYHLAARKTYADPRNAPDPDDSGMPLMAPAARCELGFLTGRGVRTFVHVEPDVTGRNYLWAQIKPYPHMTRCGSLDEACERAIEYLRARS